MTGDPTCPRCGYDQSGAIAAWNNESSLSCPTDGTCSECGLTFRWHDVIYADRLIVRGFVEHARGFWQTWRWAWATWAWTLCPPMFWRKVTMEHSPRVKWCALWILILVVPAHALAVGGAWCFLIAQFLGARGMFNAPLGTWLLAGATSLGEPFVSAEMEVTSRTRANSIQVEWLDFAIVPVVPVLLALITVTACTLLLLPAARSAARVRAPHVLRLATYGAAVLVIPWYCVLVWRIGMHLFFALEWLSPPSNRAAVWDQLINWTTWPLQMQLKFWYIVTAVGVLWFAWWWHRGLRELFRSVPHRAVYVTTMAAGLVGAAVLVVCWPTLHRAVMELFITGHSTLGEPGM